MPKEKKKNDREEREPVVIRSFSDLQRLKVEKLMKNPEKPVSIPEPSKSRNTPSVPDFVRNVMGSSAGAGSGEFHVYRHLRRKEYARQKFIQDKGEKEKMEDDYHDKLDQNKKAAEDRTAKKRAKRLKQKEKLKNLKKNKNGSKIETTSQKDKDESESESESENEHIEHTTQTSDTLPQETN